MLPVLLLFAFTACKQPASNKDKEEVKESEEIESVELDNTKNDIKELDDEQDDELRAYGLIETIEDGAYPFFVVTVNFVEREMKADFNLNIEAISLNQEGLTSLIGKYAIILLN